jgi:hypothetical protein
MAPTDSTGRIPGAGGVRRQGDRAARAPAMGWLARAGRVSRGVVYGVIGILALKLALGDGGKAANQQGALKTIAHTPFGTVLLVLMAVGLAGYALWRLTRAAVGHGAEQRDKTSDRVAALASGIAYSVLCVTAITILSGSQTGSGSPKHATSGVLGWPGGPFIVAVAGGVLIGVAAYQLYKGIAEKFLEDAKTDQMSRSVRKAYTTLGVCGHLARAVVFALIGFGLISAALNYNSKQAIGLDGALRKLAHASYGPILLGIVAAGLVMFAAYSIADARFRKV